MEVEAQARQLWANNAEHEVFSFDDSCMDGIVVDAGLTRSTRYPYFHKSRLSENFVDELRQQVTLSERYDRK
jgi:hypothetical protein